MLGDQRIKKCQLNMLMGARQEVGGHLAAGPKEVSSRAVRGQGGPRALTQSFPVLVLAFERLSLWNSRPAKDLLRSADRDLGVLTALVGFAPFRDVELKRHISASFRRPIYDMLSFSME